MKLICRCGWRGDDGGLLREANPFHPAHEIVACPECKEICDLDEACDDPECWQRATCGIPTPVGYKRLCGKHYRDTSDKLDAAEPRNNGPDREE